MSQHDFNIANQGFPATRADINNAFQAIASNSSGPTAPSTTYANQWWYDTTNDKMYLRNAADSAWIEVAVLDQTNNEWKITTGVVQAKDSDGLALKTDDGTTRLFIKDSDGAVGIGTSSPSYALSVVKDTTGVNAVDILNSTTGAGSSRLIVRNNSDTNASGFQIINNANDGNVNLLNYKNTPLAFWTNATEAMRIDSGQQILIGKTSAGIANDGVEFRPGGQVFATQSGNYPVLLHRKSTDGDIISMRKDNTTVGSIMSRTGNNIAINSEGNSGRLSLAGNEMYGWNLSQFWPIDDNLRDLGVNTDRWDDVYATNGTIQTSDQNEKQQIASLTDAEITAAKAISKLFKTFKWNDSVAEKGDAARTHTGVIAQEVEQAMTDAGLDAGDYAFFISTTWWETYTDVPAVEAVDAVYETVTIPAVLDDEGNEVEPETTEQRLVSEAVDGKEAYTRTDKYHTADEAPEGATERNRKGIRYPELLSFIGAATEQRLASIESRLDALEA